MNFAVLCLTLICIIKQIPHCIILMENEFVASVESSGVKE